MIRWSLAAAILASLLSAGAQADTLRVERSVAAAPPNAPEGVLRPVRGMSQNRVRAQFGEPLQVVGPVGEPPITRWEYPGFTVVFEHQHVVHSVVHRDRRGSP